MKHKRKTYREIPLDKLFGDQEQELSPDYLMLKELMEDAGYWRYLLKGKTI